MHPTLPADADGTDSTNRFGIYTEFDRASSPELFAVLGAVPRGKQRAQRLRMLALKGWMFEQMEPLLRGARPAAVPERKSIDGPGADDVFGAPIES